MRAEPCPGCAGVGTREGRPCPVCKGLRYVTMKSKSASDPDTTGWPQWAKIAVTILGLLIAALQAYTAIQSNANANKIEAVHSEAAATRQVVAPK